VSPAPLRFGVINELMAPADEWLARVRWIEELGYATFLIRDHFVADFFGDQYAPLAAIMAAACATSTLRVGSMVLDNDYRHPALLAKEAATIDVLSGGRLELGLGAGWLRSEYQAAGIPFEPAGRRIERLEEALQIIRALWSEGPANFEGSHYRIDGLDGTPKPAQRPHPPILLGGGKRRMLNLAGRYADTVGVLTTSVSSGVVVDDVAERTPEAVRQKIAWIREGAGDRFPRIELSLIPTVVLSDRRRVATEALIRSRGWSGATPEEVWRMPSVLVGSADQIAADIAERRELYGFSYYIVSDTHMEAFAPVLRQLA
jgi:probable F420-dependent oxidoreductase